MARAGVEPATFHFSGERYYQLSYLAGGWPIAHPATPTGLEPATSAVTGRRANQLRHGANLWPTGFLPARVTLAVLPGFGKSGIPTAWPPVQGYSARSLPGIPNGIRTRVAAVKGRSPRPLDDGSLLALASCASNREELYTGTAPKHNSKKGDAGHGVSFAQNSN